MPSIPIPIQNVNSSACSLVVPNKEAAAIISDDMLFIQQMRENWQALETWWDEVRLRGCVGASDDPAWRIRGGETLAEDDWTIVPCTDHTDFLLGGAEIVGDVVVVPRSGIYSARFQAVARHFATADEVDVVLAAPRTSASDGTPFVVEFDDENTTSAKFTPIASGSDFAGYTANYTGTVTVWYAVEASVAGVNDLDFQFDIYVDGASVWSETTTGVTDGETLFTAQPTVAVEDGQTIELYITVTGDWGASGEYDLGNFTTNTFLVVTRLEPADITLGIVLFDSGDNAVDTVAVADISGSGSAVNVAFGANETEYFVCYAYTADDDVILGDPYPPLSTLPTNSNTPAETEFSGHWVRDGEFDRPQGQQQ